MDKKINDLLLSAMFKYVKNAIVYTDEKGILLEVNQRTCELLGIVKEASIGKIYWTLIQAPIY